MSGQFIASSESAVLQMLPSIHPWDLYAAAALAGHLANNEGLEPTTKQVTGWSAECADALLKLREARKLDDPKPAQP